MKINHVFFCAFIGLLPFEAIAASKSAKPKELPTAFDLRSVFFATPRIGYAVGDRGTILKTSDGGGSWIKQASPTVQVLNAVYFLDETTGYVVGTHAVGLHPNRGGAVILKTTDEGKTWTHQSSGVRGDLRAVFFLDDSTGYAVGSRGLALRTTDGGALWTRMRVESRAGLNGLFFTSEHEGFAVGSYGTMLHLAVDDSVWMPVEIPVQVTLKAIYVSNHGLGYAVGAHGVVLRSTDGGRIWNVQATGSDADLNGLNFFNDTLGYAVGAKGAVLRKSGDAWVSLTGAPRTLLSSVHVSPSGDAHAVGNQGALLRIGAGGIVQAGPMMPSFGLVGALGIWYSLPTPGDVQLQIFDMLGRKVLKRLYRNQQAGRHTVTWAELDMRRGVYLLKFETTGLVRRQKIFVSP